MKNIAYHLICKLFVKDNKDINDPKFIKNILIKSAKKAKLTVVNSIFHHHKIKNGKHQGVSAIVIVEESHLSVYTWPEYNYVLIDILTCGKQESARCSLNSIIHYLNPVKMEILSESDVI